MIRKEFAWNYYKLGLSFFVSLFLISLHCSYFTSAVYGDYLFIAFFGFVVGMIWLLPRCWDKVFSCLVASCYFFYVVGQSLYFRLFNQYSFLTTAVGLKSEASDNMTIALSYLNRKDYSFLFLVIALCVFIVWIRLKTSRPKNSWKIGFLVVTMSCALGLFSTISLSEKLKKDCDEFYYTSSDLYLYQQVNSSKRFVELFGIENFFVRDVAMNLIEPLLQQKQLGAVSEKIESYLVESLPVVDNEKTGLLKGKNIIFFEAESLSQAVIDPVLTPTLWMLQNQGLNFSQYYAPLLQGSTSDADFMLNLGLLPNNSGVVAMQQYPNNTYPTSLANQFLEAGYSTTVSHNGVKSFYSREKFYPSLGYQQFWDLDLIGLQYGASDKASMDIILWMIEETKPFLLYNITFSGHQSYTKDELTCNGEETNQEYQASYQLVNETYPQLSEAAKIYLAKSRSLDLAIQATLQHFAQSGKLSDLAIVVVGDHLAKGFSESDDEATQIVLNRKDSLFDVPFFIWTPNLEGQNVEKPCTDIDVLPTLLNLFDMDYDSSTIMGNDIYNPEYKGYYSTGEEIVSQGYRYHINTKTFSQLTIAQEQAIQEVQRSLQMQEIANLILKVDYFKLEQ